MPRTTLSCLLLLCSSLFTINGFAQQRYKQPPDVIEAYRVCNTFQRLLAQNLDFLEAFEATFVLDKARRRAIAIADGDFGTLDYSKIDDAQLIKGYRLRMQLYFLLLPLASPSEAEAPVFFPPEINTILNRKGPTEAREFPNYVSQLEADVTRFRAHLDRLAAGNKAVADRIHKFKAEELSAKLEPPLYRVVEPRPKPIKDGVGNGPIQYYYEIDNYFVEREHGEMRITGIKFFNRLF